MSWGRYNYGPQQMAFWDFVQSLDPANTPGAGVGVGVGVDHTAQPPRGGPGLGFGDSFGPGFAFGGPRSAFWGGRGGGFGGFGGRRGGFGGRHHHPHHHQQHHPCGGPGGAGEEGWHHRGRGHCRRRDGNPQPDPEDPPADGEPADGERDLVNDPPTSVPEKEKENDKEKKDGAAGPRDPRHAHFGPPPPPYGAGPHHGAPGSPPQGPFDLRHMMAAFASHPFAQQLREYLHNAGSTNSANGGRGTNADGHSSGDLGDDDVFVPPVDIFSADAHWTIHIALPGARKEDVGLNWDADKSHLAVTGVVHRPGDEDFLRGLVSGERRVGFFERKVRLPPQGGDVGTNNAGEGHKDEVDAEGIRARMEDGVLVIVVPKVEKDEWTEVRKVDIE